MNGDGFVFEVLLIGVLILLNAFFAGAEIAVVSARGGRIKTLVEAGDRRALALIELKGDPDRFLATVQIGVTVVGTLASAVGGVAAVERLEPVFARVPHAWAQTAAEPLAVGVVVFTIAYLSLVVGELVPKSLAVRHAETLALWVARPILWLARTSRPVVAVLTASTGLVLRLMGRRGAAASPFHTLEDILHIVEEAREQGLIKGPEVEGAFAFHDVEAREVMTPRPHVVGVQRGASLQGALKIAAESRYSRFPVYEGDLDNVVGMLYARDLHEAQHLAVINDISSLVRPAVLVPGTRKAADLMADMRHSQRHLAVVVDEHGGAEGVVTLEDLLELIVGDIRDERDAGEREVMALPQGALDADGMVSVRSLNGEHALDLPESPAYVTLAGLILERLGRLPREGEVVDLSPVRLTVTALEGRRVARVRIERHEGPPPA